MQSSPLRLAESGQSSDIGHLEKRIGERFDEERFRIRPDGRLNQLQCRWCRRS